MGAVVILPAVLITLLTLLLCFLYLSQRAHRNPVWSALPPPGCSQLMISIPGNRGYLKGSFRSHKLYPRFRPYMIPLDLSLGLREKVIAECVTLRGPLNVRFVFCAAIKTYLRCGTWSNVPSDLGIPELQKFRKVLFAGRVVIKTQDTDENTGSSATRILASNGFKFDTTFSARLGNARGIFCLVTSRSDRGDVNEAQTRGFKICLSAKVTFNDAKTGDNERDVFVFGGGAVSRETKRDFVTSSTFESESSDGSNDKKSESSDSEISLEEMNMITSLTDAGNQGADRAGDFVQLLSELSRVTSTSTLTRVSAVLDSALSAFQPDAEVLHSVIDRLLVLLGWIKAEKDAQYVDVNLIDKGNMLLLLSELITKSYFPITGVKVISAFLDKNRGSNGRI